MEKIPQPFLILAACAAIAVITIIVLVQFSSTGTTSTQKERILLDDHGFTEQENVYAKISDIPPNGAWFFAYPPSSKLDIEQNTFQTFLLVRLPIWLGGDTNDTSAFRVYSAVDLTSHCIVRYSPQEGRQQIEDPCTSPGYRIIDGVSNFPAMKFVRGPTTGALPKLDLSMDKEGYLYVETPVWTEDKNGVVGIGRTVSKEEMLESSEFLVQRYKKMTNFTFDIPARLSTGEILIELIPMRDRAEISYANPESTTAFARLHLILCNCEDSLSFLAEDSRYDKYKQLWEVQSEPVMLTGQALYTGEDYVAGSSKPYIFNFVKDSYHISFEINHDFETSSKVFLGNFFGDASISDMHRIS